MAKVELRIDAEAPRRLALAQPLDVAGVANPRVQFHRLHPHPSGRFGRPEDKATAFYAAAAAGHPARLSEGLSLRRLPLIVPPMSSYRTILHPDANEAGIGLDHHSEGSPQS